VCVLCVFVCVCVCVFVFACVRERERECVCVCVRERVFVFVCVFERQRECVWVCDVCAVNMQRGVCVRRLYLLVWKKPDGISPEQLWFRVE
jgi:hypothetical protein